MIHCLDPLFQCGESPLFQCGKSPLETLQWEVKVKVNVKDTGYFNKETLNRMVDFCNQENLSPEMRLEVVKVAAGLIEFPEPDCDSFERDHPAKPEIMIRLTIQGWGYFRTIEVDGDHLEELTIVENNLGIRATIVAKEAYSVYIFVLDIVASDDGVSWLEQVNQEDIRKVWEGTYDLIFDGWTAFHGGRLNNTEADWDRVMQGLGRDFE